MVFSIYTLNVLFSSQKYGKTFTCASFLWGKSGFFGWGAAFFHSACKKSTRRVKISTRRVENSARRVDFPASPGRCRGHVERAASQASCEEAGRLWWWGGHHASMARASRAVRSWLFCRWEALLFLLTLWWKNGCFACKNLQCLQKFLRCL